jgi:hypothetical protein
MLPPEEFGNYLAIGTKKRSRGQAAFFEVDQSFRSDYFPLAAAEALLVFHPDGRPKRTKYVSIYRVLEHIPVEFLKDLYLATDDGRVLGLQKGDYSCVEKEGLHLFQQIAPTRPRIVSSLDPLNFCRLFTDRRERVSVPRVAFCELKLDDLASDPRHGEAQDLPYRNLIHLRDCLVGLMERPDKPIKTVIRYLHQDVLYRTIKNGFFVGDQQDFCYYPFPSREDLESKYYDWWRSALTVAF